MENTEMSPGLTTNVIHQTINGKYRVTFDRGATKGIIGYKVEANADTKEEALADAIDLKRRAQAEAGEEPVV